MYRYIRLNCLEMLKSIATVFNFTVIWFCCHHMTSSTGQNFYENGIMELVLIQICSTDYGLQTLKFKRYVIVVRIKSEI